MSTMQIEILNPKAAKLLKDLADLDLISITEESDENEFVKTLNSLRIKSAPSLEEITEEVEAVRSKRHGK